MDARFNSWLGCWRLEDDLAGTGARMCITPDEAGVRLQTIVGTQRGIDELVIRRRRRRGRSPTPSAKAPSAPSGPTTASACSAPPT